MSDSETIHQLRFDYEKHLFQDLTQQDEIHTWQQTASRQHYFSLHKRHLLGTAVKITDSLFPELDAIYQRCLTYIGQGMSGQLYVHQSSHYNASAYAHANQFDILLTSALVKDFKPAEIAFVIGHELGHVLFEHNSIPAAMLLFDERSPTLSLTLARRLLQWSRAAEISADRIGFLACGDLSSAANAFFKTASGIQLNDDHRVLKALRAQFDEIRTITAQFQNNQFGVSTHPLIPIRFKSLELISLDLLAFRNSRNPLKAYDLQVINHEVQEVLTQTDPVNLADYSNTAPQRTEEFFPLLIFCLLHIAISDAPLTASEEKFIQQVVQRTGKDLQLANILAEYRQDSIKFSKELLADISHCTVSQDEMLEILHHCLMMIRSNPVIVTEITAMKDLCQRLHCPPHLVDSLLSVR